MGVDALEDLPKDANGCIRMSEKMARRFWHKIEMAADNECWEWMGARTSSGYGDFLLYPRRHVPAHRLSVALHEPRPRGMMIHHECHHRACVNPAHLRAVPPSVNGRIKLRGSIDFSPKPSRRRGMVKIPLEELFWSKVDKTTSPSGCWLWSSSLAREHARFNYRHEGRTRTASATRMAYEWLTGPIPDGLFVCHNCPGGDNPLCVRPDHMFLGTPADNTRDMYRKGRAKPARGERAGGKLKEEQVLNILRDYASGHPQWELVREYGISSAYISRIVRGKAWAHLPRPDLSNRVPPKATTCRYGHPLTGDNLYVPPGTEKRQCRTCNRLWAWQRYKSCKYGHPFDERNTLKGAGGRRECRTCANRRSREPKSLSTHCKHGHALSGENLYIRPGTNQRECKACAKRHGQEFRRRQSATR